MKLQGIKRSISALLAVLLLLTAAGCSGNTASPAAGTEAASTGTEVKQEVAKYTDMMGREVELKKDIQRIALFRPRDIFTLAAILGEDLQGKLVTLGTDLKTDDIDSFNKLSEVYSGLDSLVNVGSIYDDSINVEMLLELDLDIIIVDKVFYEYYEHTALDKMMQAGLPVVFIDLQTDPFYNVQKTVTLLGEMLGKKDYTIEMAEYMNKRVDDVLQRIDSLLAAGTPKPKLYFELGNVPPSEMGGTRGDTTSGWGLTWERLGADNIGAGNGSNPMNPEQVLVEDPEVIIIGGANWNTPGIMKLGFFANEKTAREHLTLYTQREGWEGLPAVKNERVNAIHFHYHAYPYFFAGVQATAKALYPEEFADVDPEREMQAFFDKYMPFSYSGIHSVKWSK